MLVETLDATLKEDAADQVLVLADEPKTCDFAILAHNHQDCEVSDGSCAGHSLRQLGLGGCMRQERQIRRLQVIIERRQ